ncbi:MAG: helix-turn-helix transcriptional regulator [Pseudomonadota bacterium]
MKKVGRYGRHARMLRLQRDLTSIDMAIALGVTPSMVSSTERASKKVPGDWIPKLIDFFQLDEKGAEKLRVVIKINNQSLETGSKRKAEAITETRNMFEAAFSPPD